MPDDSIEKAVDKLLTPEGLKVLEGELDKVASEKPLVDIDLTEQMAFSWPNEEIEGWRNYRIEYGGCNEDCYYEGSIWLPPEVDSWKWTEMFEILQIPEARKKFEEAISKIHKEEVGKRSNWRTVENEDK